MGKALVATRITFFAAACAATGAPLVYRLELGAPMRTDTADRLAPGTYDVLFEPPASGKGPWSVSYRQNGRVVGKGHAALNAQPTVKASDLTAPAGFTVKVPWRYPRKDGAVHPCDYDLHVVGTRAFFHALLTEIGMPELDGSSKKSPEPMGAGALGRGAPVLPTATPTPKT